jgi:DNA-binding response OmpR family regulator
MKLLIIEDDLKILISLEIGLKNEKYEVTGISRGNEALDEITKFYDLALIDIMLPEISGIELATKLKKINPQTKIIFLTSKQTLEDKLKGFEIGADDYITKPFSFEELLARIKAVLKRDTQNNQIIHKNFQINLETNQVFLNNQILDFSKKEFDLFKFLIQNKNKVFSKEQLIEKIWGYDSSILPNTVEVFVKSIRDKISSISKSEKIIETVRGFGYIVKND